MQIIKITNPISIKVEKACIIIVYFNIIVNNLTINFALHTRYIEKVSLIHKNLIKLGDIAI